MNRLAVHSDICLTASLCALLALSPWASGAEPTLPPSSTNLDLSTPVANWFDALPIGNGAYGALIWGGDKDVIIRPNRLDLWDERFDAGVPATDFTYANLQKSVTRLRDTTPANTLRSKVKGYAEPPFRGTTKGTTQIGTGRLVITLPIGTTTQRFKLDLARAEASVHLDHGGRIQVLAPYGHPVLLARLPCKPTAIRWEAPASKGWPKGCDYPTPVAGQAIGEWWYQQDIPAGTDYGYLTDGQVPGWSFLVYARQLETADGALLALTITSSKTDGTDLLAAARTRAALALDRGYDHLATDHQQRWREFWGHSSIQVPDENVMRHYHLVRYYLGSNSSPGQAALATLQGLWTADGPFPPFRNNLHNDLESQSQYMAYQTAGDFAEGRVFLDYLWDLLPVWRRYATRFYGTNGAMVPTCCSLGGNPTGGWAQVWASPTYPAWLGWLFYQHWRYTRDPVFLRERAYPWCRELAQCWQGLLRKGSDGRLLLPMSTSAEIFDGSLRAWLTPNSTQDRDLLTAHLQAMAEMADELQKPDEARNWREMAGALGPAHIGPDNALMWSADEPVAGSHRHFSHAMGIWPFSFITTEGTDRDRSVIAATFAAFDRHGQNAWMGWSWPWQSALRSRIGDGEAAYRNLDIFVRGFVSRNGFHLNSDVNGALGKSKKSTFFTLEGNLLAQQAVHEMLLQSWAPGPGPCEPGTIRLFPATPWFWHEASFTDLRAEGGFKISARRSRNATVWFRIAAEVDGLVRLRDTFGGREPSWAGKALTRSGANWEGRLLRGEAIEAILAEPAEIPVKPEFTYVPPVASTTGTAH